MSWLHVGLVCSIVGLDSATAAAPADADAPPRFAVATWASNSLQEHKAVSLVRSLRRFGGRYRDAPVYVVLSNAPASPHELRNLAGVRQLELELDANARAYPYAAKAYAAAQVEAVVSERTDTLAFLDPEALVLNPPAELDLGARFDAAFKPVFLVNDVGIPAGDALDAYWGPLYAAAGVDPERAPAVVTSVDERTIRAYLNCGVYAVRPAARACRAWAELLTRFLRDDAYQMTACPDVRHRVFLHQAAFTVAVLSVVAPERRRELPLSCGYPFQLHDRLSPGKRAARLNDLSCVIFESAWEATPGWLSLIPVDEPWKSWLKSEYDLFRAAREQALRPR